MMALGFLIGAKWEAKPEWSLMTEALHIVAAANCSTARAVGLAPARHGGPGYWSKHDADDDGIACEAPPGKR